MDNHEYLPRINQAQDTKSLGIQQGYITQVSDEIEDRLTIKLSQEFSRTESRILGFLSGLDDFLLNPQALVHCRYVPETSLNSNRENQGTNEDRSQNDPHPEVGVSLNQSSLELSSEETSYTSIHVF